MAQKVLIYGLSGTGKTASLRDLDPSITAVVNPVGKPLPFRGGHTFECLNNETDADSICKFIKKQAKDGKKVIVVDDFQYILAVPYMERIKESGWDKYNDFGRNYFDIIDVCKDLPDDVCVYYLTHCETLEDGTTTVKLIGKLLREKITVEGLFTVVLKTGVSDGKYYFFTQNSGKDTVKSPMGMFESFSIDNDLHYVDAKIREYFGMQTTVPVAELEKLDKEKAGDVEKPEPRQRVGRAGKARERALEDVVKIAEATHNAHPNEDTVPFEEVPLPSATETDSAAVSSEPAPRRTRAKKEAPEIALPFGENDNVPEEKPAEPVQVVRSRKKRGE